MKTLQQNFTTQTQSKRLLELGVPANSADLYSSLGFENLIWVRNTKNELSEDFFDALINGKSANIPIWSTGRLAEIYKIISMDYIVDELLLNWSPFEYSYIEYIIDKLIENTNRGLVDFSKLEE